MTRLDLLQGTLDLLVLRTLAAAPKHGYQIARAIKASSQDVLQVEEGSLYPAAAEDRGQGVDRSELGTLGEQAASQILCARP